jgi:hypothetical protein
MINCSVLFFFLFPESLYYQRSQCVCIPQHRNFPIFCSRPTQYHSNCIQFYFVITGLRLRRNWCHRWTLSTQIFTCLFQHSNMVTRSCFLCHSDWPVSIYSLQVIYVDMQLLDFLTWSFALGKMFRRRIQF